MRKKAFIGFCLVFFLFWSKGFSQPASSRAGNRQETGNDTLTVLEMADIQHIKAIMQNDADKLVLVNVWATWCGPCVIGFPQLLAFYRLYEEQKFEMVTISTDVINRKEQVKQFLDEQGAVTRNFLYASTDKYALMEAIDGGWEGSLPHAVLIAPGGEILARYAGMIDPLVVKRDILDFLGRNYADDDK